MQIETTRLLLRDFTPHDVQEVHAFDSDPELTRYRGGGRVTEAESAAFIERTQQWQHSEPRSTYAFAIVLKEHAKLVGVVGLLITKRELDEAELWYRLSRAYWKQGYTTEAAGALLSFAFRDLRLHRIFAMCHPENIGSWRVMEKLGMQYEGRLRESYPRGDGTWCDSLLYGILAHEWRDRTS